MNANRAIEIAGRVAGVAGVVVCLGTGLQRMFEGRFIFGYENATLFEAGVALMVFYCVTKLHLLSAKA